MYNFTFWFNGNRLKEYGPFLSGIADDHQLNWVSVDVGLDGFRVKVLDFRYDALRLITIDRLHVPIFVPMSTVQLSYFHFLFPSNHIFSAIFVNVVVSACAAILRFRTINFVAKLHLFCAIFSLSQFFIWVIFFLSLLLDVAPFIYVLSTTTRSYIWIWLSYSARTSAYFFLFKTYVCIAYIPPRLYKYICTPRTSFNTAQRRQEFESEIFYQDQEYHYFAVSGVLIHTVCDKWRFHMNKPTNILRVRRTISL